jgi:putative transposase
LPDRKRNRIHGYDYSENGYYFVTVCVDDMKINRFGEVKNGKMILNQFGEIVQKQWRWLIEQYPYVNSDIFVVMPNHVHGILIIDRNLLNNFVGTGRDLSLPLKIKIKPAHELVGAFKTTSSKLIHLRGLTSFSWQRSFYDHVIRVEESLEKIREYILNNPLKWDLDKNNPNRKPGKYYFEY